MDGLHRILSFVDGIGRTRAMSQRTLYMPFTSNNVLQLTAVTVRLRIGTLEEDASGSVMVSGLT